LNQANTQAIKTALITGAARRIGAAIAKTLHQAGFRVIIHCHRSLTEAEQLAESLNQQRADSALVIQQDLCDKDAAVQLIKKALDWAHRLDVLVNNASVFHKNPFDRFDEALWEETFEANVKAPYKLSLTAYDALAKQSGVIINLTDIHAEKPLKRYTIYCQSKAALLMQTKALAIEFAPKVRVNAIAPGAILWPEADNALSIEQQEKIIAKTPLKKHGQPEYIAKAVLALIDNEFITGQVLNVDGGRGII